MIKCVYATKLGDSLLRDEEGNLLSIYPDTFYKKGTEGYWMLKYTCNWWKIIRFLSSESSKK